MSMVLNEKEFKDFFITKKNNIFENFELCKNSISNNGLLLRYIEYFLTTDKMSFDLCEVAIKQNAKAIKYVPYENLNKKLITIALEKDYKVIKYIKYDFDSVKLAVSINSDAINYIEDYDRYNNSRKQVLNDIINNSKKYYYSNKYKETDEEIFGKYIVKELGSGIKGTAYLLKNGKVLKITRDSIEVNLFNKTINRSYDHICKIYGIFRNKYNKDKYYIFKEYLTPLPYDDFIMEVTKKYASFYDSINYNSDIIYDNRFINFFYLSGYKYKETEENNNIIKTLINKLKPLYKDLLLISDGKSFQGYDLHAANIGIDKNGTYKVIDMNNQINVKVNIQNASNKLMPLNN